MNKVYKVMVTTAIAGMLLGGAVFEPTTLFAAGKKQTTTVNKAASKNDAKKVSMTQNGITLTVTKAIYDGNYVQFDVKRSGGGLKSGVLDQRWDENQQKIIGSKGTMTDIQVLIDGKNLDSIGGSGESPSLFWIKGTTNDTAKIIMVDPSFSGEKLYSFPNKFKITAKITLEGTKKPFTLELPMQLTNKVYTIQPKITKSHDGFNITANKINTTPQSTRIQLIEKGIEQGSLATSDLTFEIVDDRGVKLKQIEGFGTNKYSKNGDWYHTLVVEGLNKNVKSFTIKPLKYERTATGNYKSDKNGEPVRSYVKELEMKIKVKQ